MKITEWFRSKLKNPFRASAEKDGDAADVDRDEIREEAAPLRRSSIDIRDKEQRDRYISNCCEQMIEATEEVEKATMEYRLVTEYLKDMEAIDNLPPDVRNPINSTAERIINLDRQSRANQKSLGKISESQYMLMNRYERDVPTDIEKIQQNEEYRELVRSDMQKLESEKAINSFRARELRLTIRNMRNMVGITLAFGVLLIFLLCILQFVMELDATVGFFVTAAAAAAAFTAEYVNYSGAAAQLRKTEHYLNAVVAKQNKVKVRYVNTTNLLEYVYRKYHINVSNELVYYWDNYLEEKKARQALERNDSEIAEEKKSLVKQLRKAQIHDPNVWVNQCEALVNPKEMVEVRHDLIVRRQSLRKRVEYNTENRDQSKDEINSIVHDYPEYGREILAIVSKYDQQ